MLPLVCFALGIILICSGLVFTCTSIGWFQESFSFRESFPYDPFRDPYWKSREFEGIIQYIRADYNWLNTQYHHFHNYSVGVLHPGCTIELIELRVYPTYGYRWTAEAALEEFHPSEEDFNSTSAVYLFEDGQSVGKLGKTVVVAGRLYQPWSYVESYEVTHEGMSFTLHVSVTSNAPNEAIVSWKVATIYGRIAPYLMVGGLVLGVSALLARVLARYPKALLHTTRDMDMEHLRCVYHGREDQPRVKSPIISPWILELSQWIFAVARD